MCLVCLSFGYKEIIGENGGAAASISMFNELNVQYITINEYDVRATGPNWATPGNPTSSHYLSSSLGSAFYVSVQICPDQSLARLYERLISVPIARQVPQDFNFQ